MLSVRELMAGNSLVSFLLRGSINQEELLKRAAWAAGISEVSKI